MKKVVCLIAVLALTATVSAQEPIEITASVTDQTVTIGYNASGLTMPVGISLIVDCGAGGQVAGAGDIGLVDSFFDVFIDFAADDPATYQASADPLTGVLAGAHPLAKTDQAGSVALPASVFAISAAELANTDTVPAMGTICTLTLTEVASAGSTQVCFSADTLRGEVVDVNGEPMAVTLPGCVTVNFAAPATCWDACAGQPSGDATCDGVVNLDDLNALKASWGMAYGDPPSGGKAYNCCANFDHIGAVNLDDLNIMKANWGDPFAAPPTPILDCPAE
jgi:hypothetical protein